MNGALPEKGPVGGLQPGRHASLPPGRAAPLLPAYLNNHQAFIGLRSVLRLALVSSVVNRATCRAVYIMLVTRALAPHI